MVSADVLAQRPVLEVARARSQSLTPAGWAPPHLDRRPEPTDGRDRGPPWLWTAVVGGRAQNGGRLREAVAGAGRERPGGGGKETEYEARQLADGVRGMPEIGCGRVGCARACEV